MLYFVRHGETVWNVENKICGATDSPLTELGHRQAIETAEKIRDMGIKADMILYSPLSRAKDTAMHISEICGIPMKEEKRLFEQNFGKYDDGSDYILVAHNGIARVVQSYFYEMTNDEYASFGIRNCEIREYRF